MKKILFLIGLFFFTTAAFKSSAQAAGAESVYDRVMRTGVIRCGYVIYPPACIKDPNTGKLSGIFVDAVNKAAENLQLKAEWTEEVGWGTMLEGLQDGRYDVIASGVFPNMARTRIADFSVPLYYTGVGVFVRPDDIRFTNRIETINDPKYKIATVDGSTIDYIARNKFPLAQRLSLPDMTDLSQMMLSVAQGKADVTFTDLLTASDFMRHNPGALKNISPMPPIWVFANVVMFNRSQMEFKNMLDRALEELLNSGYIDTLIQKYAPDPKAVYSIALPYRTQ